VIVYVDGYNVYHGLCDKQWRRYLWLDYRRLFERELRSEQTLVAVNYFTALGRKQSPESTERQQQYLAALEAHGGVNVIPAGKFKMRPWRCEACGHTRQRPQEKMTDVAIAVQLTADAHADAFDTAWLMCADADLIPAVRYVAATFPDKVLVVLPPRGRRSDDLIAAVGRKRDIGRSRHAQAQLPDVVLAADGKLLRRPAEWGPATIST